MLQFTEVFGGLGELGQLSNEARRLLVVGTEGVDPVVGGGGPSLAGQRGVVEGEGPGLHGQTGRELIIQQATRRLEIQKRNFLFGRVFE